MLVALACYTTVLSVLGQLVPILAFFDFDDINYLMAVLALFCKV